MLAIADRTLDPDTLIVATVVLAGILLGFAIVYTTEALIVAFGRWRHRARRVHVAASPSSVVSVRRAYDYERDGAA